MKHIIGEKNDSMLIGIQTGIQSPAALRQPMMPGFPVQNSRGPPSTYPYHQVKFCQLRYKRLLMKCFY